MKIHFSIDYRTKWGEELRILLSKIDRKGNVETWKECPMETYDGHTWETEITFQQEKMHGVEYKYAMLRDGELVWTEWEVSPHRIIFDDVTNFYTIQDKWRPIPEDLPLYSSAYTECIGVNPDTTHPDATETLFDATLQIRVVEPELKKGEALAICGSSPQFGEWRNAKRMTLIGLQEWAINIDAALLYNQVEYKYVVVNDENEIIHWEAGNNRRLRSPKLQNRQMWIKTDHRPNFGYPNWKAAGVVIPVFSIRTNKSYGIGDFGDLKTMIQWAVKTKMHAIQILPINDTTMTGTWMDSYPYNSISIYAFNPIYTDINALPTLHDKLQMEKFLMKQQKINQLEQIDYEAVIKLKMDYLRFVFRQENPSIFGDKTSEEATATSAETLQTEDFKKFFKDNKDWLVPYAVFSHLRDSYGTADFSKWPQCRKYDAKEVAALSSPENSRYKDIALYYYIQYNLHLQLLDARNTARANGIILKGDIPIGISRCSVEAWSEPHLFNLDGQAGAPPDDFSANGQNWGFPTYNWEVMAENGYQWWLRRFGKMSEYFDAYRIDHVLGFFRIWEIPMSSVHGLTGQFVPSLPMSVNEIESYGLKFRLELFTRPFITEEMLDKIFDYRKDLVKIIYLNERTDGRYDLKDEFSSQRLIEAAFRNKTDEDNIALRDGLYALASCVLFVPDRKTPELFHPRISAQNDYIYKALPDHEKRAFDNLYNEYYYRRHNDFWYEEAMKKLPVLTQSTRMLVCAEDLGMVPDCVAWVMNNLKMLSLEIQSMPKQLGLEFGQLWQNPYRSVATISTHDMSPLRLWWEEDAQRTQKFYNMALQKDGPAPHPAPGWVCEEIINRHLFSPSVLCLLSLQDWLSMDENIRHKDPSAERINIPANPRHYWRYRMHISVEQLLAAEGLNGKIRSFIENSGRA